MNILFMSHRVPFPPNKGDKLRSFHFLDHLAAQHSVWCASFVDDPGDLVYENQLRSRCCDVCLVPISTRTASLRAAWNALCGRTLTESYYSDPTGALAERLGAWAQAVDFDVVFAFSSSMAPWALKVPARRRVLDLCDLDSAKWSDYARRTWGPRGWLYAAEGRRMARREWEWIRAFDASLLISEAEAADLPAGVGHKVHVVSNGVELPKNKPERATGRPATVGFVGVMDYLPNVDAVRWFARKIWPQVHRQVPSSRFQIIGRRPAGAVRRLDRLPGVEVVGEVPDVGPYVRDLSVSIAPLRIARGIQNKVLEAMAFAKPVVLTPAAAAGLALGDGRQAFVAGDAETFASRVIQLLSFPSLRTSMGEAAHQFVSTHHTWRQQLERLDEVIAGDPGSAACPGDTPDR